MTAALRALIVDDSPAAREVAEASLEAAADSAGLSFEILKAEGGMAALKVLATQSVDLLLVDLHMPDLHGLEVLSFWRQREHTAACCAVVISTAVSGRDREKAIEAGATAFLEKPVSAEALAPALELLAAGGAAPGGAA
jgi:two-component system chemotaxis response regulator CheY